VQHTHLDIEGGWKSHGDEESSSKEASQEEEVVGASEEATATSPPHLPFSESFPQEYSISLFAVPFPHLLHQC
jgi:hypothetical protein